MKTLSKILLTITSFFILLNFNLSFACDDFFCLWDRPEQIQYCRDGSGCSLSGGIDQVKNGLEGIEKDRTFSEYIQDIIAYLIGFLFFIALLYVLYAGLKILISKGDEEELNKSKSIISYVIIGIILIFLAYSIVSFIVNDFLRLNDPNFIQAETNETQ